MVADPGALDPQMSAVSALFQLSQFAYDNLVSVDANGEIGSQLAKDWKVDGTTVTLTLNDGLTCSDGSDFTARDRGREHRLHLRPGERRARSSGRTCPAGMTAAADGATLTLTLAAPSPFVMQSLANVPMVCDAGLADREQAGRRHDRHRPVHAHRGRSERPLHVRGQPRLRVGSERRHDEGSGSSGHRHREGHPQRDDGRQPAAGRRHQRRPGHRTGRRPPRGRQALLGGDRSAPRRAVVQPGRRSRHERPGRAHGADPGGRLRRAAEGAHSNTGLPAKRLTVDPALRRARTTP